MNRIRRRKQTGLTLLELMLAMVLVTILALAVGYTFIAGLDMQRAQTARLADVNRTEAMQKRITQMLQSAKLTSTANDLLTYFTGQASGQSDNNDLGCDQLVFTTTAPGIPMATQNSQDDFETQQNNQGPIGGVAEVSYSMTAVGDAGNRTGLFERVQQPADGDPTQGGMETLLSPDVQSIGFQFWDGLEWTPTWDTTTGTRRLPAAVKVSYTLKNATDSTPRVFIVPIPASDVTDQNPVTNAGGTQ